MAAGKSISRRARRRARRMSAGIRPSICPADKGNAESLAERIQAEREHLFRAISIVELCRFAASTLLEAGESEHMITVFETTGELLNASAERLEWIASDMCKLSRKDAT